MFILNNPLHFKKPLCLDSKGKVYYWGTFRDGSGAIGLTHDGNIQKLPVPLGHHLIVKKIASGKPFLISFIVVIMLRLIPPHLNEE